MINALIGTKLNQTQKFLDTGKGFDAASALLEDAYRKHKFTPIDELKRIAM